jgi:hypothetical protein
LQAKDELQPVWAWLLREILSHVRVPKPTVEEIQTLIEMGKHEQQTDSYASGPRINYERSWPDVVDQAFQDMKERGFPFIPGPDGSLLW